LKPNIEILNSKILGFELRTFNSLGFDENNPERGILSKVQSEVAHKYYHVFIISAPYSSIDPYFPDYCKHHQQQSFLEEGG